MISRFSVVIWIEGSVNSVLCQIVFHHKKIKDNLAKALTSDTKHKAGAKLEQRFIPLTECINYYGWAFGFSLFYQIQFALKPIKSSTPSMA
jgi:hypothetical protein